MLANIGVYNILVWNVFVLCYVYWFFLYFWEFLKEKIHFGWGNEKKRNRNNIQELFLGRGRSILDYCDFGRLKVCSPSLISLSDFYVQIDFWWKFGGWLRCDELCDIKRRKLNGRWMVKNDDRAAGKEEDEFDWLLSWRYLAVLCNCTETMSNTGRYVKQIPCILCIRLKISLIRERRP